MSGHICKNGDIHVVFAVAECADPLPAALITENAMTPKTINALPARNRRCGFATCALCGTSRAEAEHAA
jgi:hypothetical protein